MVMSPETKNATIEEWRKLGFFYDYNGDSKNWLFIGSVDGIYRLCQILEEYTKKPKNEVIGEHDHLGPYMYLKIGTWKEPVIDENGILGTLQDIVRLADIIKTCLNKVKPEDTLEIDKEYSWNNSAAIKIAIREVGFDPASADSLLME